MAMGKPLNAKQETPNLFACICSGISPKDSGADNLCTIEPNFKAQTGLQALGPYAWRYEPWRHERHGPFERMWPRSLFEPMAFCPFVASLSVSCFFVDPVRIDQLRSLLATCSTCRELQKTCKRLPQIPYEPKGTYGAKGTTAIPK